jgi:hypothetical protein
MLDMKMIKKLKLYSMFYMLGTVCGHRDLIVSENVNEKALFGF